MRNQINLLIGALMWLKNTSRVSSNGSPKNYCGVLKEHLMERELRG